MPTEIVPVQPREIARTRASREPPALVTQAGSNARFAYEEFFEDLDSDHTYRAYRLAQYDKAEPLYLQALEIRRSLRPRRGTSQACHA